MSDERMILAEEAEEAAELAALTNAGEDCSEGIKKKKRLRMLDATPDNDIKYNPPLSYRHLKLIAWLFLVLAQVGAIMGLLSSFGDRSSFYTSLGSGLTILKGFAVPLLLVSCLSVIMNGHDNYKQMIVKNGALALTLFLITFAFYERVAVSIVEAVYDLDHSQAAEVIAIFVSQGLGTGYISFNIFVDLFLCSLTMFFINYNPTKHFQGWKIHLFRAMVFLPIGYEIFSIVLKVLASEGAISLPVYVFPLLTTKPPLSFLLFIIMARYFKEREIKFLKNGKTSDDYKTFLKTRFNAFQVSRVMVIMILIIAVLDVIIMIIMAALSVIANGGSPDSTDKIVDAMERVNEWGFGQCIELVVLIPIMFLFSYTKTHKNGIFDIIIPVAGVAGIILVTFDGIIKYICSLYIFSRQ
ncbi:MAG: hypothetical protein IKN17_13120 [Ruminococcus sp.]|nr:hypothetical protein [Ruminococcus sp.]